MKIIKYFENCKPYLQKYCLLKALKRNYLKEELCRPVTVDSAKGYTSATP